MNIEPTNLNAGKSKRWKIIAGVIGGIIAFCCACIAITGVMDKLGLLPTLTPTLQSSSTSTIPPRPKHRM